MSVDARAASYWHAYTAVIVARYRMLLQYRAAAFAGFATQCFWGAILIMVLAAFYAVSRQAQPMTLGMAITYVWLGQAFLGILPWNVDPELAELIRTGGVSYELVRPLDLYQYWYCRTIALRTATTTLRSIPMFVVAMVLLPLFGLGEWALSLPAGPVSFALFVVSLGCAVLLAAAITMLMQVALVLTVSGEGLNRIMPAFVTVLSGNILPLPLFPDWMQWMLSVQPFRGVVDVPFRIYCGHIQPGAALPDILQQVAWTLIFVALGRWSLSRSMRRLVVQGG